MTWHKGSQTLHCDIKSQGQPCTNLAQGERATVAREAARRRGWKRPTIHGKVGDECPDH